MIRLVLLLQMCQYFKIHRRQILLLIAAGLTGCVNATWNQDMTDTEKRFWSFKKYFGKLHFGDGTVPGSMFTSSPVPVRRQGRVQIAYMICPYTFNQKGSWIWPPNEVVRFDPVSGKLTDKNTVTPDDFDQADPIDKKFKKSLSMPSDKVDEFNNLREHLFELYDVLFAAWAANPSPAGQGRLQNQARDFLRIFDQLAEEPLKPYYEALGRDWFGWLRALAQ